MRRAWRWVARNWPRSLYLASWPPMVVADAFLLTEPKHGANTVPFWVAIGACAAMALGAAAMLWRDYRRLRKEEEALSLAAAAVSQALNSLTQMQGAIGSFSIAFLPGQSLAGNRPTSPLDKSVPAEPRTDPIVGYRLFRSAGDVLAPVGMCSAPCWAPGENVARDRSSPGPVPPMPGFWALRTLDLVQAAQLSYPEALVVGAVEMYGRLVEHELGWRAEKARILAVAGLSPLEHGAAVYSAGDWETLLEVVWGQAEEARAKLERYPRGDVVWVDQWRRRETAAPIDVTAIGRRYGVPAFGSLEGLQAFAREMGAEE